MEDMKSLIASIRKVQERLNKDVTLLNQLCDQLNDRLNGKTPEPTMEDHDPKDEPPVFWGYISAKVHRMTSVMPTWERVGPDFVCKWRIKGFTYTGRDRSKEVSMGRAAAAFMSNMGP